MYESQEKKLGQKANVKFFTVDPYFWAMSFVLTIADGRGRGVQESLILADVICEQPLIDVGYLPEFC